jgi:hypothetical protein
MRMNVACWLLAGTALLISLTNELAGVSATLAWGLQHVRSTGPLGLDLVAFITSPAGRVLLLVVALGLLLHAGTDARGRSSLPSVTLWGVRAGWRAVRQWITPTR